MRDQDPTVTPALLWLDRRLLAQRMTADEIVRAEHQAQGAMNVTVGNVITSMRFMSAIEWAEFFESVSHVDAVLRENSNFAAMDFPVRDRYRHAIEELAQGSDRAEIEVAPLAIAAAKRAAHEDPSRDGATARREHDPGYYLISRGRHAVETELGFRVPRTHLLSNGRYTVMITAAGSGFSRWRDLAVTRWREDVTCDSWGTYIFLRDVHSAKVWSAGTSQGALMETAMKWSFRRVTPRS